LDGIEVLAFAGFTGICHLQLLVHMASFLLFSFTFSALSSTFFFIFFIFSFFHFFYHSYQMYFFPSFPPLSFVGALLLG